jgi:hypothetical protein
MVLPPNSLAAENHQKGGTSNSYASLFRSRFRRWLPVAQ